jgi:hypothetical protein
MEGESLTTSDFSNSEHFPEFLNRFSAFARMHFAERGTLLTSSRAYQL